MKCKFTQSLSEQLEDMPSHKLLALIGSTTDPAIRQAASSEVAFREKFAADTAVRVCWILPSDEPEVSRAPMHRLARSALRLRARMRRAIRRLG